MPASEGPLLLLGDSLTEAGPWEEAFPDREVVNAGVPGDTTADVAARLDDVVARRPGTVVLMAGTNESRRATVEQVVRGLEDILFQLRHELPDVRLVVTSVLPRERERADWIREVNIHVRQFAPTVKAEFLDLWPTFAEEDGELRPELTNDRLHLTDAGYAAWVHELRTLLG
ncbi:lysophospholipase L1-like esterase [Amnibacterium kyonggiense]|uniref:Lysophospholipase L1-like esterase n=1 Tax=Amnibacterium kyonggiense TaxID=595671 RepID=A0A4R7FED7_9MICO|nr:lysophospholipase L1-like esterase [Amnibacterium kyonggiense]